MSEGPRPWRRRWWLVYPAWIAFCALLFVVLQAVEMEDPSRRRDRITSQAAGEVALDLLHERDAERFGGYDVVNVAWAREREVADDARWVVLLDRGRTGFDEAIVVELDRAGNPIRIRSVFR